MFSIVLYFHVTTDSESLCDYNIVEGNKLHLFVREDATSTPQQSAPDFFEQLQKFLEKHFTPNDAEKVLEEFRKVIFILKFLMSVCSVGRGKRQSLSLSSLFCYRTKIL